MSDDKQPEPRPLDAERQRLRALGHTEEEISDILVRQTLGGGATPSSAPVHTQGIFSNVLSSLIAVVGYVGGLFTSVRQDVATILDRSAPTPARTGAFVSIAVKAIIVGVLAYAGLQEWQQHINSATEIAAAQAKKLQIEADNAKALNEAQVKKLEAEAAVAKQVNDAQAQKLRADADAAKALNEAQVKKLEAEAAVAKQLNDAQAQKLRADADAAKALNDAQVKKLEAEAEVARQVNQAQATKTGEDAKVAAEVAAGQAAQARKAEAEAKYAEELAEGQKAQACTARMDMIAKTLPMAKWGPALEEYNRDCDPAYAAQAKACNEKFGSVINAIETTVFDNNFSSNVKVFIDKYKQECRITPEQEKRSKAILERKFATTRFGGPDDSTKSTSTPSASVPSPEPSPTATERPAQTQETPSPTPSVAASPTPSYSALATPEPTPSPTYAALSTPQPTPTATVESSPMPARAGWFGARMQEVDASTAQRLDMSEAHGLVITWLAEDSPSLAAGLATDDVILSINGDPTNDLAETVQRIRRAGADSTLVVRVLRIGNIFTARVRLGERPPELDSGAVVDTIQLNLRSCPEFSPACPELARLPQGYHVTVNGKAGNGWYNVTVQTADGKPLYGFVNGKYLRF